MGRFICRSRACGSSGWGSKKIAITIRMYPGAKYNVWVYKQHCKGCNGLSKPGLDDSYAERVAYRLKKWCGIEMDRPNYSGQSNGLIRGIYVKDARMAIAINRDRDGLTDKAIKLLTSTVSDEIAVLLTSVVPLHSEGQE